LDNDWGILRRKSVIFAKNNAMRPERTSSEYANQVTWSPLGVFAVVEKQGGEETLHYILKDHQGNWTVIVDADGAVEQELSYDAWGNRRDPNTWYRNWNNPVYEEPMFDRGYTGHEHLYAFGLINMNGRCYDPVMSSFLSVDAYVQSPDNSQNFNRYSYCLNNPLKYIDPSGWRTFGASMGSHATGAAEWGTNYCPVYEPRDLGLLQLPENAEPTSYYRGNDLEGGNGGCSNSGEAPIIDPSEMPESQQESFNDAMKFASENSSLFQKMYEILSKSSIVYKIMIGETDGDVPAQYNPNNNTVTFRDESELSYFFSYCEELFHAFQYSENHGLYSSEFNYEYEAKVFKFFVYAQIFGGPINTASNDSFIYTMNFLCPNGFDVVFPTAQTISGNAFLNGYYEGANKYTEWNILNSYGNSNYKKATLQPPVSLIKVFQ
jgi:RHS repeat-associated protein